MTAVPRKEQAQRRRTQLLDVALEAFIERGVENVSVADLAARAGVAHGLIYHYFGGGKDELILAVFEHASPFEDFVRIGQSLTGLPVDEGLRLFGDGLAAVLERRGDVVRLLLRESLSPRSLLPTRLADLQEAVLGSLGAYLDERIDAGEVRPHDVRAPFRMLISSALVLEATRQPVAPWIPAFVDTILSGIHAEEER